MEDAPIRSKSYIQTVQGQIENEELGWCQCHEHVFIRKGKPFEINPSLWMESFNSAVKELMLYKRAGGNSIVDAQPIGCGRMANELLKSSMNSEIHIIASTGFHKNQFYPNDHWLNAISEDALTRIFISEITDGMYVDGDNTAPHKRITAKAGIIKTALDSVGINGIYIKLFSAAAAACLETGLPILCHIEKGSDPFKIVEFLVGIGINPTSIILCHLDRAKPDIHYHREIAKTGVYLEYDTIARFKYHSNEDEIKLILQMIQAGYEDRILLGLDTTRERLKSYGGSIGLDYIHTSFIPMLLSHGITDTYIHKFMVMNPRKALCLKS